MQAAQCQAALHLVPQKLTCYNKKGKFTNIGEKAQFF